MPAVASLSLQCMMTLSVHALSAEHSLDETKTVELFQWCQCFNIVEKQSTGRQKWGGKNTEEALYTSKYNYHKKSPTAFTTKVSPCVPDNSLLCPLMVIWTHNVPCADIHCCFLCLVSVTSRSRVFVDWMLIFLQAFDGVGLTIITLIHIKMVSIHVQHKN